MNDNYRTDDDGKVSEEAPKGWKKATERQYAAVRGLQSSAAGLSLAPPDGPATGTDRKPAFRMTARAQARRPFIAAMGSDDLMSQAQEDDDPAPIADGAAARS